MEAGTQESLNPKQRLIARLRDVEYRKGFVEGHATDTVAFQLRAMRKAKGWEQSDVADKLGNRKLQPMISRYENPDYGKYSISTLIELANAFDVALAIRFVSFSELVEWDLSLNRAKDCPISFADDKRLEQMSEGPNSRQGMFAGRSEVEAQDVDITIKAFKGLDFRSCEDNSSQTLQLDKHTGAAA